MTPALPWHRIRRSIPVLREILVGSSLALGGHVVHLDTPTTVRILPLIEETRIPMLAHSNRLEQVIFNLLAKTRDAIDHTIRIGNGIDDGNAFMLTFPATE